MAELVEEEARQRAARDHLCPHLTAGGAQDELAALQAEAEEFAQGTLRCALR
jgi:hypothetical protein